MRELARVTVAAMALVIGLNAQPSAGQESPACSARSCGEDLVYIGTQGNGAGQGIFTARFDPNSGRLTLIGLGAEVARPTWLLAHPSLPVIWANSDPGADSVLPSRIIAYRIDPKSGALREASGTASGGKGPTHSSFDPVSKTLFVANYASATVAALPVRADGTLDDPSSRQNDFGTGPGRRQSAPHSHAAVFDSAGHHLLVPDLGADRLFVYRFDAKSRQLSPAAPPYVQLTAGAGPRHAAVHPGGSFVYLISELRPAIDVFRWSADHARLDPVETIATMPDDAEDKNKGAEIMISPDGRFLYTSNRGEDFILVQSIDPRSGKLTELQRISSGGQLPWNFVLHRSGRWMLVANQASGSITVFARDTKSGKLSATEQSISLAKPTSVVFASRR